MSYYQRKAMNAKGSHIKMVVVDAMKGSKNGRLPNGTPFFADESRARALFANGYAEYVTDEAEGSPGLERKVIVSPEAESFEVAKVEASPEAPKENKKKGKKK